MASSTWDGCTLPEEQAEPEETAIPSRSKPITAVSALRPGAVNSVVFGSRGDVGRKHHDVRRSPQASFQPVAQSLDAARASARGCHRGPRGGAETGDARDIFGSRPPARAPARRRAAAARARSRPPPGPARRRPWGRRSCAQTAVTRSAPTSLILKGIFPNAWIASTCSRPPAAMDDRGGLGDRLHRPRSRYWQPSATPAPAVRSPASCCSRIEIDQPRPRHREWCRSRQQRKRPPASTEACSIAETSSPSDRRPAAAPETRGQRQRVGLGASGREHHVSGHAPTASATAARASSISGAPAGPRHGRRRDCRRDPTQPPSPPRASRSQRRRRIPVEIDAIGHGPS